MNSINSKNINGSNVNANNVKENDLMAIMKQRKAIRQAMVMDSVMFDEDRYIWRKDAKGVWRLDISQFIKKSGCRGTEYMKEDREPTLFEMMKADGELGELHEAQEALVKEEEGKKSRLSNLRTWLSDLRGQVEETEGEISELSLKDNMSKADKRRLNKLCWLRDRNLPERIEVMEGDIQECLKDIQFLSEEDVILVEDNRALGYDGVSIGHLITNGERLKRKLGQSINKRDDKGKLLATGDNLKKLSDWVGRLNLKNEVIMDVAPGVSYKYSKVKRVMIKGQWLEAKAMVQQAWVREYPNSAKAKEILAKVLEEIAEHDAKQEERAESKKPTIEGLNKGLEEAQEAFSNASKEDVEAYGEAFNGLLAAEEKLTRFLTGESDPMRREYSFTESFSGRVHNGYDKVIDRLDDQRDMARFSVRQWWDEDYSDLISE